MCAGQPIAVGQSIGSRAIASMMLWLVSGLGLEIHEWSPTLHHRRTIVKVVQAYAATLAGSRMCAFITLAGR